MTLVCLPGLVLTDLSWTYFMCSGNIVRLQNRYMKKRCDVQVDSFVIYFPMSFVYLTLNKIND